MRGAPRLIVVLAGISLAGLSLVGLSVVGVTPLGITGIAAARPAARTARPAAEVRYSFLLSRRPAGTLVVRRLAEGSFEYRFEFSDRGRGPKETTLMTLGPDRVPIKVDIDGHDYLKNPVAERFTLSGGRARWKNAGEQGEVALSGPAFYVTFEALPAIPGLLAHALMARPDGRLPLLPAGEARVERLGLARLDFEGHTRTVDQVAIVGLGFSPVPVWLDQDGTFFASNDGWTTTIREGWEGALPQLLVAQEATTRKHEATLAARLAHHPAAGFAITGARLFDAESGRLVPGTTVVVGGEQGERILAVGPDGTVAIPPGAEVVAAGGRTLLPGLWDLHAHITAADGLLDMAAGVTTVRDMANDIDQLLALRARWLSGAAIGPRVLMAGFIDGPGPYAGPSRVLVSTPQEVDAAVDRYAALGFEQIKVYSSLSPALVPEVIARARRHGLRVSGHIPAFMTAEQAVREGFDEIQHVNFLFLNFLFDKVQDTRTPVRFTAVAEHAAELDLSSPPVRAFIALLAEKKIAVDPTLSVFEAMFTDRPGTLSATYAAVADRVPAQVRRQFLAGGGLPVPPGKDGRYRDSFRALLRMVKALWDAGVTIEVGTDSLPGFTLHRELELDVEAGIPAADALRLATLGAARVMHHDAEWGSIAPGKLADMILVDGDPTTRISDIRRVVLTVKGGVIYDPGELYQAIGVAPVAAGPSLAPAGGPSRISRR